jgi:gluconokinase
VKALFNVEGVAVESPAILMSTYPKSPKEMIRGLMYFPRMIDKIRLHARGELPVAYHANFGTARSGDAMCCNFLRVKHAAIVQRVAEGGTDEEILEWCYTTGRRLNTGDVMVWNGFISKLGWNDFAAPSLQRTKQEHGIPHREDIATMPDFIDFDEQRIR